MSRLLDYNPLTGESVHFHYDAQNDTTIIEHRQDTTHIIEANKRALIEADHQAQVKNDWIKYASIPNIVIMEWKSKYGVDFFNKDHWPRVMSLINSRDYRDVKQSTLTHDR